MRKSTQVALLVAGLLLIPVAVFASHQFTDVPNSHTFHNAIGWMKDNNITVGCNPPANTQYCPNANVSRGQMAAFMKRLAENNVVDAATVDGIDSTGLQTVVRGASEDFYTGVNPTFNGYLKLLDLSVTAPVAGTSNVSGTASVYLSGLPVRWTAWVQIDNATCTDYQDAIPGGRAWGSVGDNPATLGYSTLSSPSAVAVSAGAHTLTLCAQSLDAVTLNLIDASLTSVFSPGGSVLPTLGTSSGGGGAPGE